MTTVPKTEVPLPARAVSTFLREAADPRVSHRQMIKTISGQRALNQFIKKASESPLFRKGQPAPTVLEASMQIGRRALLALSTAWSVRQLGRRLELPDTDYTCFWEGSVRRGAAALLLGRHMNFDCPEEAFGTAFIQDIGLLRSIAQRPEQLEAFQPLWCSPSARRRVHEQELLGVPHDRAAIELFEAWAIPGVMADTIVDHHKPKPPLQGKRAERLLLLCHTADLLADVFISNGHPEAVKLANEALEYATQQAPISVLELCSQIEQIGPLVADLFQVPFQARPEIFVDLESDRLKRSTDGDELAQIKRELRRVRKERDELHAVMDRLTTELTSQSNLDQLTLVSTRDHFLSSVSSALAEAKEKGWPLCVVVASVDGLSPINTDLGLKAGDEVLRDIVGTWKELLRPNDLVGRLHGDVFAVLMRRTPIDGGLVAARRLRQSIEESEALQTRHGHRVAVSVGGRSFQAVRPYRASRDSLIAHAESAMLTAKSRGGNLVVWHR
ncbi:MAG: diguanylate cyclase [Myxococcota bacterium]